MLILSYPGVCSLQVVTAASYDVIVMYRSQTAATFKLSLGPYNKIVAGTAPSLTAQLPPSVSQSAVDLCHRNIFLYLLLILLHLILSEASYQGITGSRGMYIHFDHWHP